MELVIIIAFLLFIGYREWMTNEHIKDLELKALSKTPQEYAQMKNIERKAKVNPPKEEDELVDLESVNVTDVLKGINKP